MKAFDTGTAPHIGMPGCRPFPQNQQCTSWDSTGRFWHGGADVRKEIPSCSQTARGKMYRQIDEWTDSRVVSGSASPAITPGDVDGSGLCDHILEPSSI